eukprot:6476507-Amphidinium_carterae.2
MEQVLHTSIPQCIPAVIPALVCLIPEEATADLQLTIQTKEWTPRRASSVTPDVEPMTLVSITWHLQTRFLTTSIQDASSALQASTPHVFWKLLYWSEEPDFVAC